MAVLGDTLECVLMDHSCLTVKCYLNKALVHFLQHHHAYNWYTNCNVTPYKLPLYSVRTWLQNDFRSCRYISW